MDEKQLKDIVKGKYGQAASQALRGPASVGRRSRGLFVTLFVNRLVKPFSMALFAWLFFRFVFSPWISPAEADQYIAGSIILAAAPCTAMVFVWSNLVDGDPAYTLVQVSPRHWFPQVQRAL